MFSHKDAKKLVLIKYHLTGASFAIGLSQNHEHILIYEVQNNEVSNLP